MRTKSNRFHFPVLSNRGDLLAIELKLDAAGVSGLDGDLLAAVDGKLAARRQKLR